MRQSWNRVRSVVLAAGLACGLITAASAQSVILSLDNVNFSDGSTASGTISLNAYGQVEAADVNVTAGTLPAEAYFIPGPEMCIRDRPKGPARSRVWWAISRCR